ncbi:hydroxyacid dehydrogenase [Micromonospora sp. CPCC 206061]|uniref:hydroxyacid dehydrogenase n=1 Tax=Micromonospora sp. CPCC 206061 TaxID=3122410 RepID=UPI002FF324F1
MSTSRDNRPQAVLAMRRDLPPRLFDRPLWNRLHSLVAVAPDLVLDDFDASAAGTAALADAEILITGWECPPITAAVLDAAPRLAAVVHTGGSVKAHVTEACWARGVVVSSAAAANALPVAEYTIAAVILAAKGARALETAYRARRGGIDALTEYPGIGGYRRTVGVVGASRIGRRVIELLRPFDFEVSLYDPLVDTDEARRLGVRLVDLPDLLRGNDIVTLHAPSLPSTRHMIDRAGLASMRDGATLINTARGALVDQDALVRELVTGRLHAVIDVTDPEVPPADSPLYDLPNAVLTPHIAGALGNELHRLGACAVDEIGRYVAGLPFAHGVAPHELEYTA